MSESASAKAMPAKKRTGPAPKAMPAQIDASPRDLAMVIMENPPKKTWRFLEKKGPD